MHRHDEHKHFCLCMTSASTCVDSRPTFSQFPLSQPFQSAPQDPGPCQHGTIPCIPCRFPPRPAMPSARPATSLLPPRQTRPAIPLLAPQYSPSSPRNTPPMLPTLHPDHPCHTCTSLLRVCCGTFVFLRLSTGALYLAFSASSSLSGAGAVSVSFSSFPSFVSSSLSYQQVQLRASLAQTPHMEPSGAWQACPSGTNLQRIDNITSRANTEIHSALRTEFQ